jgi:hypothetical protein
MKLRTPSPFRAFDAKLVALVVVFGAVACNLASVDSIGGLSNGGAGGSTTLNAGAASGSGGIVATGRSTVINTTGTGGIVGIVDTGGTTVLNTGDVSSTGGIVGTGGTTVINTGDFSSTGGIVGSGGTGGAAGTMALPGLGSGFLR